MQIPVHMRAFCDKDTIRMVEIDDKFKDTNQNTLLDLVFANGQNEIQNKNAPSVSVGDIIELPDGTYHIIAPFGFKVLTKEQVDGIPGHFASTRDYMKMMYQGEGL